MDCARRSDVTRASQKQLQSLHASELSDDDKNRLLQASEWREVCELEGVLSLIRTFCNAVQYDDSIMKSETWVFISALKLRFRNKSSVRVVDQDKVAKRGYKSLDAIPRSKRRYHDLSDVSKTCWERLLYALDTRYPDPDDAELLAMALDPRTSGHLRALLANCRTGAEDLHSKAVSLRFDMFKETVLARQKAVGGPQDAVPEPPPPQHPVVMDSDDSDSSSEDGIALPAAFASDSSTIGTDLAAESTRETDHYVNAMKSFQPSQHLKAGLTDKDLKDMARMMASTDIRRWVVSIKDRHPVAFRVLQRGLGPVSSSGYIERFFSTASQVWNTRNTRILFHKAEINAVLKHSREFLSDIDLLCQSAEASLSGDIQL